MNLISMSQVLYSVWYVGLILSVCNEDEGFTEALQINLQRLIAYAKSADTSLQREVAEKLANEAVKRLLYMHSRKPINVITN